VVDGTDDLGWADQQVAVDGGTDGGTVRETSSLVRMLPAYSSQTGPMHILYAPDRQLTPKLRAFIDFAVATFRRDA